MNINEEIQKASDKIIAEKLPKMVEDATTEMLKGVINDIFRGYSPLAKSIKEKIEAKLDINLQQFDLVEYNVLVADVVNRQLLDCLSTETIEPIQNMIKNVVGFVAKKEIKLSEIFEMVKAEIMEDSCDEGGEFTFMVKLNQEHKWVEVYIDDDKDVSEYQCALRFIFSFKEDNGRIFSMHTASRYTNNKSYITPVKAAMLRTFEAKLFKLYASGTVIIADETEFDTEWNKYND